MKRSLVEAVLLRRADEQVANENFKIPPQSRCDYRASGDYRMCTEAGCTTKLYKTNPCKECGKCWMKIVKRAKKAQREF
jgi:hypothetical protein